MQLIEAAALSLLFSSSAMPIHAYAQITEPAEETAASSESPAGDIIVTASKIGGDLEKAPVAATTLTASALTALGVRSVRDAQVRLPSLVYDSSGGSAQVYIRGIGTNSAYAGLESSVGTYVDGVYLQRQVGASVDVLDLRSIEVLNGPQGSLYGRNATGGVILVNTNDPTQEFGGRVRGTVGNYGRRDVEAIVNAPLSDELALRVAGQFSHLDGFTTNIANGDRLSGYNRGTGRAKLKWTPTSEWTFVLSGEYHKQSSDPIARRILVDAPLCFACAVFGTSPPPADNFYEVSQTRTRNTTIRYTAATLNAQYSGDTFDIVSVTGIRDFHYKVFVDQDFADGDLFNSRAEEFGTTFTQDAYIRTHFDGPFDFLAGISGEIDDDSLLVEVFGAAFGTLQGAGGTSKVKLASISPYAEGYVKLTDSLKLTVGGRYNIDRKKLRAVNNADATPALGAAPLVEQKAVYRNFTPRIVLSRETPRSTVYASYSKGAKSGGFNTPAFTQLTELKPETLESFEAGVKANGWDGRIRVSAAAFLYNYKDIQVSFVDAATGGVRAENAASARVYGLELSADLRLAEGLTLSGGGLMERARFRKFPSAAIFCPRSQPSPGYPGCPAPDGGPGLVNGVTDLSGGRLPRAPDVSLFGAIEYGFPLGAEWEGLFVLNNRYTSEYNFSADAGGPLGLSRQKGYNLMSASLALTQFDKGFDVRFFVNNLTKARYYDEVPTAAFGIAGTAAAPRTYGVSIGYSF